MDCWYHILNFIPRHELRVGGCAPTTEKKALSTYSAILQVARKSLDATTATAAANAAKLVMNVNRLEEEHQPKDRTSTTSVSNSNTLDTKTTTASVDDCTTAMAPPPHSRRTQPPTAPPTSSTFTTPSFYIQTPNESVPTLTAVTKCAPTATPAAAQQHILTTNAARCSPPTVVTDTEDFSAIGSDSDSDSDSDNDRDSDNEKRSASSRAAQKTTPEAAKKDDSDSDSDSDSTTDHDSDETMGDSDSDSDSDGDTTADKKRKIDAAIDPEVQITKVVSVAAAAADAGGAQRAHLTHPSTHTASCNQTNHTTHAAQTSIGPPPPGQRQVGTVISLFHNHAFIKYTDPSDAAKSKTIFLHKSKWSTNWHAVRVGVRVAFCVSLDSARQKETATGACVDLSVAGDGINNQDVDTQYQRHKRASEY